MQKHLLAFLILNLLNVSCLFSQIVLDKKLEVEGDAILHGQILEKNPNLLISYEADGFVEGAYPNVPTVVPINQIQGVNNIILGNGALGTNVTNVNENIIIGKLRNFIVGGSGDVTPNMSLHDMEQCVIVGNDYFSNPPKYGWNSVGLGFANRAMNYPDTANVFIGAFSGASGFDNQNGKYHTFVGAASGSQSGLAYNTLIGSVSSVSDINAENAIGIGYNVQVDASNKVVIGNNDINVIGGIVNWSVLSDKRFKKNISTLPKSLQFILDLNPVKYEYNLSVVESSNINGSDKINQALLPRKHGTNKIGKTFTGLLAQEVEAGMIKNNYQDFSGLVGPKENGGKYALRYSEFVIPLISAVKELNQNKDKEIASLRGEISDLTNRILQLEKVVENLQR